MNEMSTMKRNIIQSILVFAICNFILLISGFIAAEDSLTASLEKQCFWMENISRKFLWVPAPQGQISQQECYELDSCNGGGGKSAGGCYIWTTPAQARRKNTLKIDRNGLDKDNGYGDLP